MLAFRSVILQISSPRCIGKTIQAISLVLYNRPNSNDEDQKKQWDLADQRHEAGVIPADDQSNLGKDKNKPSASKVTSSTPRAGKNLNLDNFEDMRTLFCSIKKAH